MVEQIVKSASSPERRRFGGRRPADSLGVMRLYPSGGNGPFWVGAVFIGAALLVIAILAGIVWITRRR